MTEADVEELIPQTNISLRIKFRAKLFKWRQLKVFSFQILHTSKTSLTHFSFRVIRRTYNRKHNP